MIARYDLIIRNACDQQGMPLEIAVRDGSIIAMAARIEGRGPEFDCAGKTLIAGLHDHHIHLLATAAKMESVDLSDCKNVDQAIARLRNAAAGKLPGEWVRAIGYDEALAGLPSQKALDDWLPNHKLRIQDRTGALWMLNSAAIRSLGNAPFPDSVASDNRGSPTGHIWRGDAWLRSRIGATPPSLADLGRTLGNWGITGVTDAGANNGPEEARLLSGAMPQQLIMMGLESLSPSPHYQLGAVKLLFDERDLPPLESVAARIRAARVLSRPVAAHCVTRVELLYYLAALEAAGGTILGDRIEHGGIIPPEVIRDIAADRLIVVTQPGFIFARGDRYLAEVAPVDLPDLYRLGSLLQAGVQVLAGSDAPYADPNPWTSIMAACSRKTRAGATIGKADAIGLDTALSLHQGAPLRPGNRADFCLLSKDWQECASLGQNPMQSTFIGGEQIG